MIMFISLFQIKIGHYYYLSTTSADINKNAILDGMIIAKPVSGDCAVSGINGTISQSCPIPSSYCTHHFRSDQNSSIFMFVSTCIGSLGFITEWGFQDIQNILQWD